MSPIAYTAPTTRITGDVITSGHWNTDITSNVAWLATDKPMVRVKNSAGQNTSNNAYTALTFDSEDFDNSTIHSTSSNTSRLTFATAGRYLIGGASVVGQNTGDYHSQLIVMSGGTEYVSRSSHAKLTERSSYAYPNIVTLFSAAANGYVELFAWQLSADTQSWGETGAETEPSNFWAVWLSTA